MFLFLKRIKLVEIWEVFTYLIFYINYFLLDIIDFVIRATAINLLSWVNTLDSIKPTFFPTLIVLDSTHKLPSEILEIIDTLISVVTGITSFGIKVQVAMKAATSHMV